MNVKVDGTWLPVNAVPVIIQGWHYVKGQVVRYFEYYTVQGVI